MLNPISKFKSIVRRLSHTRLYDDRKQYQLQEISILRKVVSAFSVDCIFDIGANKGQYARMLRESVGYHGSIISVEPNPYVYGELQKMLKFDAGWSSRNLALADHDGELPLSIMAHNEFTSLGHPTTSETSSLSHLNSVTQRVNVPVKTLRTFYMEEEKRLRFKRPFLKMDTQGYDGIIAKSAGNLIRRFVGIQTEVSFVKLYEESLSFQETLDLYRELGFSLCAIFPNNAGHFPQLIEQDAIFINKDVL